MGTLYLVATPIGNLSDFPPRGTEVLKSVSRIYAEDTRRSGQLLAHFSIDIPLSSYFEQVELRKIPEVLSSLSQGDVALISDAGTPTISDPGFKLVREASKAGHKVIPVPGPSALLLALVASGLPTDRFTFLGFLPKKDSAQRKTLSEVKDWRTTLIIYESPFRVKKTLRTLLDVLGDRPASVSRELTKLYEETERGSLSELSEKIKDNLKGEVTIVVGVMSDDEESQPPEDVV